ncbi:hypothetical protein PCANC_19011 [Puccinia coronata f. sp. avenae]|uniref:Uncharacterized protein n=1 Tax=Puccinia coronata f. sp. avenae TaxID=200324 RepID=A0A2N5UH85_9BASI|nr:hypothetical protein PCANC_19011 [Puccinia coronata f. sp. avenae]
MCLAEWKWRVFGGYLWQVPACFFAQNPDTRTRTWYRRRGLIAARPKGVRTPIRTPNKHGVQPLHAPLERRAGAARHVHAYNRRAHGEQAFRHARQACRACTPVWRACKACTPFGQVCRPCTPVGSRKPLDLRGLREPRYPYKGTAVPLLGYRSTLIRVLRYPYKGTLCTLIRVPVPL